MANSDSLKCNYFGYAILIVNSYRENTAKYPIINGACYDENELKSKLEEIGFFVYSIFGADIMGYRSFIYKLNSMYEKFPIILFIFSGYENGSQIIFEDGIGIEYQDIFNDLINPVAAWSKCPKVIIINTYKPRLGLKSIFNYKSKCIPFLKSPLSLTLYISHSQGAAEKRGPLVHDIFVSKFIEELNLSEKRVHNFDFRSILKHVKRSIETISRSADLNIIVRLDDQLIDPLHFGVANLEQNVASTLSDFTSTNNVVSDSNFDIITQGLDKVNWFYSKMSRDVAEAHLIYDGDFLLRQSDSKENCGRFVISVLYHNMLYQIPLYNTEFGVQIKNGPIFKKLTELIEYYFSDSHPIPIHNTEIRLLQTPQSKSFHIKCRSQNNLLPTEENNFKRWFHGKVGRDHVQQCLINNGDFLVWETESCFILSYVYEDEIHNIYAYFTQDGDISTDLISGKFESIDDLIQHLILHHSYYRGVFLKNAVPPPLSITPNVNSPILQPLTNIFESPINVASPAFSLTPIYDKSFDVFKQKDMSIIDISLPLIQQKWFSNALNSSEVFKFLKNNGDFLVRTSQTRPGNLSLSVKAGDKIQTFGIFESENKRYTLNPKTSPNFSNIVELIKYYVSTQKPLPSTMGPQTFLIRPIIVSNFD